MVNFTIFWIHILKQSVLNENITCLKQVLYKIVHVLICSHFCKYTYMIIFIYIVLYMHLYHNTCSCIQPALFQNWPILLISYQSWGGKSVILFNSEYILYFFTLHLQLVEEFLSSQKTTMAPQTFHMGGLLQEMREIEEAEQRYAPQRGNVFTYMFVYKQFRRCKFTKI